MSKKEKNTLWFILTEGGDINETTEQIFIAHNGYKFSLRGSGKAINTNKMPHRWGIVYFKAEVSDDLSVLQITDGEDIKSIQFFNTPGSDWQTTVKANLWLLELIFSHPHWTAIKTRMEGARIHGKDLCKSVKKRIKKIKNAIQAIEETTTDEQACEVVLSSMRKQLLSLQLKRNDLLSQEKQLGVLRLLASDEVLGINVNIN